MPGGEVNRPIVASDLVTRLEEFRRFPGYRLEPRFDVLLAPFLPAIVAARPGSRAALNGLLIPEFPVPLSIAKGEEYSKSYRKVHVDFLLIEPEGGQWHFIELKTSDSVDLDQNVYLCTLQKTKVDKLVEGVRKTFLRDSLPLDARGKYAHLLRWLAAAGAVKFTRELPEGIPTGRGWKELWEIESVNGGEETPLIWYLAPESVIRPPNGKDNGLEGFTRQSLGELARIVEKQAAPGAADVAAFLRKLDLVALAK